MPKSFCYAPFEEIIVRTSSSEANPPFGGCSELKMSPTERSTIAHSSEGDVLVGYNIDPCLKTLQQTPLVLQRASEGKECDFFSSWYSVLAVLKGNLQGNRSHVGGSNLKNGRPGIRVAFILYGDFVSDPTLA